jgi:biotin carboxyl carrier protein
MIPDVPVQIRTGVRLGASPVARSQYRGPVFSRRRLPRPAPVRSGPGQVRAPYQGAVTLVVSRGERVAAGEVVATIEALKMEAAITAPLAGRVTEVCVSRTAPVDGGDLLLVVE